ncbi:lon protease homolog 2, peroxisomal-like isoform X2 [Pomacea canaliculata]|uniref:lon protease homolog 2, peroxisomal-like isoform X2 n=1 Tax=Pomacea canaliculata TaxID=400727 RepID=UPI000D727188|nr:lon protease homolog 2, peroxisomal-like isoform X2 [Pomacea canaliculata]
MAASITIPKRLPLLVVADNVLLPGSSMRIPVRSLKNMNMVKSRLLGRNTLSSTVIGVIPKDPAQDRLDDDMTNMHSIGTAAVVVQITGTNWPRPAYTLLVTGICRFRIESLLQETPYPVAMVTQLDKLPGEEIEEADNAELLALTENFREQAAKLVDMLDTSIPVVARLKKMLDSLPSQHLPDICSTIVKASYAEKIQVLDAVDLTERFKKALPLLVRQIEGLKLLKKARNEGKLEIVTRREVGQPANMRNVFRKIERVAEDEDDDNQDDVDEVTDLEQKIKACGMPPHALKAAMKELKRLKKMPQHMPEHAMIRNYLELMLELPWAKSSKDMLDIVQARKDLDADHYGLEKLKKRVLEYLAVRQIKAQLKGPILCFVGPPGVGKTSIGRSIANTLGREFHRIALGGVCDQSDIRGHRRTYIGSMPGRIIQGLKTAGTNNPVFLLDEIDKMSTSLHGDPAAALLEVLDPEQNHSFVDHYLNVPFDLSQVLFIATANSMSTIPPALIDRTELIMVPGYTQEEKVHIAQRHLIPKQLDQHGLTAEQLVVPEDAISILISKYTREAGVRTLERRIAAICRAVAVKVLETRSRKKQEKAAASNGGKDEVIAGEDVVKSLDSQEAAALSHPPEMPIVIDEAAVEDILGPPMFEPEMSERLSQAGVAVGLAWTAMGGEIMFVEATRMEGEGKLTLTGQLGDVMKESANLALNWVRANARKIFGENKKDILDKTDIHIHFPAGAVGKDGPSAGVTIITVLVSLFSDRCVRSDTAMTGEITLRGLVLPVGGIKEKVLAAHRAGLTRVILPARNEKDMHEVPNSIRKDLSIIFVSRVEDVLNAAFDGGFPLLKAHLTDIVSKL